MVKDTSLPVTLTEWKLFRAVEAASKRKNLPWVRFKHETLLLAWHFKPLLLGLAPSKVLCKWSRNCVSGGNAG